MRIRTARAGDGARAPGRPVAGASDPDLDPTVCAGYSTALPEVVEAVALRGQVKLGTLRDFCEAAGLRLTEHALIAQAVLEGAVNEMQEARAEQRREEAEAKGAHHGR